MQLYLQLKLQMQIYLGVSMNGPGSNGKDLIGHAVMHSNHCPFEGANAGQHSESRVRDLCKHSEDQAQ